MEFVTSFLFSQQLGIWSALLLMLIATSKYLISLIANHFTKNPERHKLPPGPKPWPIVGNLPEMLLNRPVFRCIHNIMDKMDTEIACIRLGNVHVIPVTSPSIACEFLRKQDSVFASRPLSMSTELVSSGYLTIILAPFGEQWKKMKKVVANELLSPSKLAWLHDQRLEEADNLTQYVYNQCKTGHNGLVNVRIAAQHYCGNVIRRMVFNKRYFGKERKDGGPGIDEVEHVDAIFTLLKYVYAFSVSDFTPCLRRFDLDGHRKLLTKALAIVRKYHDPIIEERLERWKDGTKQDKEDLLDVLITLKDADNNSLLTSEEIKAQIIDLMIASVDNPSNAVEWTIAETINQPELLERATKELDRVVGKKRQVRESDLSKLNYVKACARESFRLHPVFALNPPHVSMADAVVASYFIPKGSHVCVSRLGLGRNPRVWKEPLKFKPERHLKSDDSDLSLAEPDLNILSFSTGRRGFPGVMLGTKMTIMLLARLLHGFSWSALPNESGVDLAESKDGTSLAKPLLAMAKPRLPSEWYLSD